MSRVFALERNGAAVFFGLVGGRGQQQRASYIVTFSTVRFLTRNFYVL